MERHLFVDAAMAVVGLGANPRFPEKQEAYAQLIAPDELPLKTRDMLRMSGCALTVAGIWRAVGITHTKLNPPYVIGTAVSRLLSIARQVDAWVPYSRGALPRPGDVVLVGDNKTGGTEHVFLVSAIVSSSTGDYLESIDGGQRDAQGYQVIERKKRLWIGQLDAVYTKEVLSKGRKIIGWVDCTKLPGPTPCPS